MTACFAVGVYCMQEAAPLSPPISHCHIMVMGLFVVHCSSRCLVWQLYGALINRRCQWVEWETEKIGYCPPSLPTHPTTTIIRGLYHSSYGHLSTGCPWTMDTSGSEASLSQAESGESIFLSIWVWWSEWRVLTASDTKWEERMWGSLEKSITISTLISLLHHTWVLSIFKAILEGRLLYTQKACVDSITACWPNCTEKSVNTQGRWKGEGGYSAT